MQGKITDGTNYKIGLKDDRIKFIVPFKKVHLLYCDVIITAR